MAGSGCIVAEPNHHADDWSQVEANVLIVWIPIAGANVSSRRKSLTQEN